MNEQLFLFAFYTFAPTTVQYASKLYYWGQSLYAYATGDVEVVVPLVVCACLIAIVYGKIAYNCYLRRR